MESIPAEFGEAFLEWFRARTETAWASYQPKSFHDDFYGADWQPGTRWTGGLTDDEIAQAEARWGLRFPPDYRLFLRRLHITDRPMLGTRYLGARREIVTVPSFYDWREETELFQGVFDWPRDGLLFDVRNNNLWLPSWGAKPEAQPAIAERVSALVAAAPKLIPIFGHRYLLGEPCRAGNPVLSAYQSDIIVYGDDLRHYLLHEFATLLGIDRETIEEPSTRMGEIPFWDEIMAHWPEMTE